MVPLANFTRGLIATTFTTAISTGMPVLFASIGSSISKKSEFESISTSAKSILMNVESKKSTLAL